LPPEPIDPWELPTPCVAAHNVGKLVLGISNKGYFGNNTSSNFYDCRIGNFHFSGSEYPQKSLINHLWQAAIWVGGVRGTDTLVSEGFFGHFFEPPLLHQHPPLSEFNPDGAPLGEFIERSTVIGSLTYDKSAISQQDFIAKYTDTTVVKQNTADFHEGEIDFLDLRLHKPLFIKVQQNSYAWSHEYSEDIAFFEYLITNIGEKTINDFSFGINLRPHVGYKNVLRGYGTDDLLGFYAGEKVDFGCEASEDSKILWIADNDGDPFNGAFTNVIVPDSEGYDYKSVTSALGVSFIFAPDEPHLLFNWWTYNYDDFGPVMRGNYRNFHTGYLGDPKGDRNKFFVMGNGEIDYDPAFTKKIDQFNETWLYPDQEWIQVHADGSDAFSGLLSFRRGFLTPGGTIPIVIAIVAGENFHRNPSNLQYLPNRPDRYYSNLDFSDLERNTRIAKWIYDNPGVDTDKDGYAGEFRVCVIDSMLDGDSMWIPAVAETTWYKGDGVPDWKPALPPPVPEIWVTPVFRGIHIRFNGQKSENSKDIFTQMNDFEGYNIYIARDERETSYSLVASYDIENYDKYVYNYEKQPDPGWDLLEFPMTLEEIRCNYAYN
jgi:hypothetical protein